MTVPAHPALPPDGHVHSEWSWDAPYASMERACRRAIELGLPSIAFTDHADFTTRRIGDGVEPPQWQRELVEQGVLAPRALDVEGYLRSLNACRRQFAELRIRSGVELGEPHWHEPRAAALLSGDRFERVLASVHTLPAEHGHAHVTVDFLFATSPPDEVVRRYLREVLQLVERFDHFHVLAHIDYAARFWPREAEPHQVGDFEDEYRAVLAVLAAKGKALEVNTRVPLALDILHWWRDEKGEAVAFGSDAHRADDVARGFVEAAALAEATGFVGGRDPHDVWMRR